MMRLVRCLSACLGLVAALFGFLALLGAVFP